MHELYVELAPSGAPPPQGFPINNSNPMLPWSIAPAGEKSNPAGAVDQGSIEFELIGKPCGGSPGGDQFHCLSPHHANTMGVKYMTGWVSTSGTVGSNLLSETQTGAKILWI
ncbi:hypothetical protein TNCV_4814291 [Trichonephila clavipes]|nr:hypothetical protein TNCV_4814291 [Trichonephila clavipes]